MKKNVDALIWKITLKNENHNNNHNRNIAEQVEEKKEVDDDAIAGTLQPLNLPQINNVSNLPLPPKLETDSKLTEASSILNDKMDIFGREQLEKKNN